MQDITNIIRTYLEAVTKKATVTDMTNLLSKVEGDMLTIFSTPSNSGSVNIDITYVTENGKGDDSYSVDVKYGNCNPQFESNDHRVQNALTLMKSAYNTMEYRAGWSYLRFIRKSGAGKTIDGYEVILGLPNSLLNNVIEYAI